MVMRLTRKQAEDRYVDWRMKEIEEGVRRFAAKMGNASLAAMLSDLDNQDIGDDERHLRTEYQIIIGV